MSELKTAKRTRKRGAYSRLICLGCRERRIKCELPDGVETPDAGEFATVQTPCYRCKRLGIPCVVRQTILGRPGPGNNANAPAAPVQPAKVGNAVPHVYIDLALRGTKNAQTVTEQLNAEAVASAVVPRSSDHPPPILENDGRGNRVDTLLTHTPQSTETVTIIRALDMLRYMKVEKQWFRHLPARTGHSRALDFSIKAIVAACAYARHEPTLTPQVCYQVFALALHAVQTNFKKSTAELSDNMLAATALLAHFEGVTNKNGIPTRLHVQGLAAILKARSATHPITHFAMEIVDFHVCDAAIMACIQGTFSPFEKVPRAYFVGDRTDSSDSDQKLLKGLGSELFVRIPRLVTIVRSLQSESSPLQYNLQMDCALKLSRSLLSLQDPEAESRLLQTVKIHSSDDADATLPFLQYFQFASTEDFEALAYYWQNRLCLLRLERRLQDFSTPVINLPIDDGTISGPESFAQRSEYAFSLDAEIARLAHNILMCTRFAGTLPVRKHARLFAHAILMVWGATMPVSAVALNHIRNKEGDDHISELLTRRLNVTLTAKPPLTVTDIDTAAEIFVGGELKGRFIELYSRSG